MGILNVTPDSFSDGGLWDTTEKAAAHGRELVAQGADLVDVGGESTRPGARRIDEETELARVVPVIAALSAEGVRCSVDTTRSGVARAALASGAAIVNDVSGGLADPLMARVVADAGVSWILMHWRGHSRHMQDLAVYDDVVREVRDELLQRVEQAVAAGVDASKLILDPGLGFAKTAAHNWALLHALGEFTALGFPILIGASRKRFLGELLAEPGNPAVPAARREAATTAISTLAAQQGVWGIRVHEPRATVDALLVERAWARGGVHSPPTGPRSVQSPPAGSPAANTLTIKPSTKKVASHG